LIVDKRHQEGEARVTKVEVFDPPMCCSSGVCGPNVDPTLARLAADLHWLSEPLAFCFSRVRAESERHRSLARPLWRFRAAARRFWWRAPIPPQTSTRQRLRDPEYTRVILVTLPEATPVHEAARLQADLERAGITPYAWVINQSFSSNGSSDPLLIERREQEAPFIAEVEHKLAKRTALVPWTATEPAGPDALRQLTRRAVADPARGEAAIP
jgi:hypothetical protein